MITRRRFIKLLIFGTVFLLSGILLLVFSTSNKKISRPTLFVISQLTIYPGFFILLQGLMWLIADLSVPKPANVSPIAEDELMQKLLSINSENSPIEAVEQNGDISFIWKLADAKWYEFFAKAGLKEQYKLSIRLRDDRPSANVIEEISSIEYGVGFPLKISGKSFRGWSLFGVKNEIAYGVREILPPDLGKLYQIKLNTRQFRGPILKKILDSGWAVEPCLLSLRLGI